MKILVEMPEDSVNMAVTSPPYYKLKNYGLSDQIGWEPTIHDYLLKLKTVLKELFRVTRHDGSCFLVIGDSLINRSLQLIPHRLSITAIECGWTIRNDLIWSKSDATPGSGNDGWRLSHGHILFMTN